MKKPLVCALVAAAAMLAIGAPRSWAGTITFNNSSINPEGAMAIGDTGSMADGLNDAMNRVLPSTGFADSCGPSGNTVFGCPDLDTPAGADTSSSAVDFDYSGGGLVTVTAGFAPLGFVDTSGLTGLPVTLESVVAAATAADPSSLGGNDPNLWTETPLTTSASDNGLGNTTALVVDPSLSISEVPESGSLILVGIGLVTGARYLRRKKVA